MSIWEMVAVALAGVGAGAVNTVVGSGTLITFPTLLAVGLPPVLANVSNNIGLVPGAISGSWGYRRELSGQRSRVLRFLGASFVGGLAGAVLLLVLPAEAFGAVVPALILLGVVLVLAQPRISRWVAARHADDGGRPVHGAWWVVPAVALAGVYGGYFGAAQGVLLMAILGIGVDEALQRLNALKNVLSLTVNSIAAVVFVAVADVDWIVVALIAVGSTIGGQVGATVGRRLPPGALRAVIAVVGIAAVVFFVLG